MGAGLGTHLRTFSIMLCKTSCAWFPAFCEQLNPLTPLTVPVPSPFQSVNDSVLPILKSLVLFWLVIGFELYLAGYGFGFFTFHRLEPLGVYPHLDLFPEVGRSGSIDGGH